MLMILDNADAVFGATTIFSLTMVGVVIIFIIMVSVFRAAFGIIIFALVAFYMILTDRDNDPFNYRLLENAELEDLEYNPDHKHQEWINDPLKRDFLLIHFFMALRNDTYLFLITIIPLIAVFLLVAGRLLWLWVKKNERIELLEEQQLKGENFSSEPSVQIFNFEVEKTPPRNENPVSQPSSIDQIQICTTPKKKKKVVRYIGNMFYTEPGSRRDPKITC
ncbi:hypothetical protein SNEBB_011164 [Seison nebaliae]|nr:hypothetical protein SNEBB_011164 [Seison nebaliae]